MREATKFLLLFLLMLSALFLIDNSIDIYSLATEQNSNLVKNGEFTKPLIPYWEIHKLNTIEKFPNIFIKEGVLCMEVPFDTSCYVSQRIFIPDTPKAILSLKVWGSLQSVIAKIFIVNSNGKTEIIDSFSPDILIEYGGKPITRFYDITKYSGQEITLILYGEGLGATSGSFVFFDDIKIQIVTNKNSIVLISFNNLTYMGRYTATISLKEKIGIVGKIYPEPNSSSIVAVRYYKPNGEIIERIKTTDIYGKFSDQFTPDEIGMWKVDVIWKGNEKYNGSISPPLYFIVRSSSKIKLLDAEINGIRIKNLDRPKVTVLAGQRIEGWIKIKVSDGLRFTNLPIIGLNTWERDKWDLIGYQLGVIGEQIGYKECILILQRELYFDILPVNYTNGLYEVTVTWHFPQNQSLPNDLSKIPEGKLANFGHPSFKAPLKEGIYYIVIVKMEQNYAYDVVHARYKEGINSIWDLSSKDYERLFTKNLTKDFLISGNDILLIEVIVKTYKWYIAASNLIIGIIFTFLGNKFKSSRIIDILTAFIISYISYIIRSNPFFQIDFPIKFLIYFFIPMFTPYILLYMYQTITTTTIVTKRRVIILPIIVISITVTLIYLIMNFYGYTMMPAIKYFLITILVSFLGSLLIEILRYCLKLVDKLL